MKYDFAKVAFIGDTAVGKTTIVKAICGKPQENTDPTIGAFCEIQNITNINGKDVKAVIWDTAGQERFRAISPIYIRNSNIVVLVYDVNNRESFENMKEWIVLIRDNVDPHLLLIVGNKIDLPNRKVNRLQAIGFSIEYNCEYCECSAISKKGASSVWKKIEKAMYELVQSGKVQQMETMDPSPKREYSCCTIC